MIASSGVSLIGLLIPYHFSAFLMHPIWMLIPSLRQMADPPKYPFPNITSSGEYKKSPIQSFLCRCSNCLTPIYVVFSIYLGLYSTQYLRLGRGVSMVLGHISDKWYHVQPQITSWEKYISWTLQASLLWVCRCCMGPHFQNPSHI